MKPRDTPQTQFSSFARLEDDGFRGWMTDPRLLRSMERQMGRTESPSELMKLVDQADSAGNVQSDRFWALFWHRTWQGDRPPLQRLAEQHLVAYLQEPCYWVAHDIKRKTSSSSTAIADYFQMAMLEVKDALSKFESQASNNLKAFASVFLGYRLKSIVRSRNEAGFCTDWGLLRKTSKKRLLEALARTGGLNPSAIEQYRLLWMGYQDIYVADQAGSSAKLPEPTVQQWEAIAQLYNSKRHSQLSQIAPQLSAVEAATRLQQTARWVRAYCYPPMESLNRKRFGSEEDGGEVQDWLSDEEQTSVLDALIAEESQQQRQQYQQQLQTLLREQFQQLDAQSQTILCLLYVEGLSQQAIMKHTELSQPTISRRLKRARQQLAEALLAQLEPPEPEESSSDPLSDASASTSGEVPAAAPRTRGSRGSKDGKSVNKVNKRSDPDQMKLVGEQLETCLQINLRESSLCPEA